MLRLAVLVVPVGLVTALTVAIAQALPPPDDTTQSLAYASLLLAVALLAAASLEELTRRVSPLVWLLRLSLLFPGEAPSRFRVALRAGNTNLLRRLLERSRNEDEPARAAELIITLATAISAHDARTRGHSERVRAFTELLADELGVDGEDVDKLRWAALLHDVGKLRVPGGLLNKPSQPDPGEWEVLRRHPTEGARIAAPLLPWLGEWGEAIAQHHERHDGQGYPRGLTGGDIAYGARIVAVADAFETMTAPRTYRLPVSAAEAQQELANQAGRQFDPEVVRAFLSLNTAELRRIAGPLAWVTSLSLVHRAWALREPVLAVSTVGVLSVGGLSATSVSSGGGGSQTQDAPTVAAAEDAQVLNADIVRTSPQPPDGPATAPSRPDPIAAPRATTTTAPGVTREGSAAARSAPSAPSTSTAPEEPDEPSPAAPTEQGASDAPSSDGGATSPPPQPDGGSADGAPTASGAQSPGGVEERDDGDDRDDCPSHSPSPARALSRFTDSDCDDERDDDREDDRGAQDDRDRDRNRDDDDDDDGDDDDRDPRHPGHQRGKGHTKDRGQGHDHHDHDGGDAGERGEDDRDDD